MDTLLGFPISGWDYITFLVIFIIGVAFLALAIFIFGLPGRIAIARNHPEADAVNAMRWSASWPSCRGSRHLSGRSNRQQSSTSVTCPKRNGAKPQR